MVFPSFLRKKARRDTERDGFKKKDEKKKKKARMGEESGGGLAKLYSAV